MQKYVDKRFKKIIYFPHWMDKETNSSEQSGERRDLDHQGTAPIGKDPSSEKATLYVFLHRGQGWALSDDWFVVFCMNSHKEYVGRANDPNQELCVWAEETLKKICSCSNPVLWSWPTYVTPLDSASLIWRAGVVTRVSRGLCMRWKRITLSRAPAHNKCARHRSYYFERCCAEYWIEPYETAFL